MLSRRDFLGCVGGAMAAGAGLCATPGAAGPGPARVSQFRWAAGWLLWRDYKPRRFTLADALKDLKEAGADGIEFTPRPGELDSMGVTLDAVSRMVKDAGLAVSGHYFSGPFLDASKREELFQQAREKFDSLKAFGARHLVIGPPGPPGAGGDRMEAIARMAPVVAELGRRAQAEGISIGIHPHLNTLVESPEETDRFMEAADPAYVGLALDTGHFHLAGGDVLKVLDRHGARVNYLHFKDAVRPFKRPDFFPNLRELGRGEVDFPGVMRALKSRGYSGWIDVEQDFTTSTPTESCRTSFAYIREVLDRRG
jgi:inosose dehydratase